MCARGSAWGFVMRSDLRKAVAHYLFIESKDEPPEIAGLLRAAALALIGKPVDDSLLSEAKKSKSDDEPLYDRAIDLQPRLDDLWDRQPR